MFNNEQYCTAMNKMQDHATLLPWDNPRFKNWIAVARSCQLMERSLARELQPLDIKVPHLDILANLYRFPGITQQSLARKLLVGRSNMSMLLPQLEKRGLLTRTQDENDKRALRLHLTDKGVSITEQAMAIHVKVIERSMVVMSLEECNAVGDAMTRLSKMLQDDMA